MVDLSIFKITFLVFMLSMAGTARLWAQGVPPINNDCGVAISLTPAFTCSPTTGTTAWATQSFPAVGCGDFTGNADDDVWYSFKATSTSHRITVSSSIIDAVIEGFSGTCGALVSVGCADLYTTGTETMLLTGLSVGATYYVRVYDFDAGPGNMGSFTICITQPPTNDNCDGAISLTPGTTCTATAGSTLGATQSQSGCTGWADDDVWFSFTATGTTHIVTVDGAADFDAVFQVFSGACGSLVSLRCEDNTDEGKVETATLTGLTVGATYRIRVYHYYDGTGSTPTFDICVTNWGPTITDHPLGRTVCSGSNAAFSVSATGATSYKWQVNPGSGFADVSNSGVYSGAGTNTLTITGVTGAMSGYIYRAVALNGDAFTNSNAAVLTVSGISGNASVTHASCMGSSDGSVDLTPSGGTPAYTYAWTGGSTTQDQAGLAAGIYSVTITDGNGSTCSAAFTVTEPLANSEHPATANASQTQTIGSGTSSFKSSCQVIIVSLTPGSSNGVSGDVTAKVFVQSSAGTYDSKPYVRRYYDIAPGSATSTATANVTLYFTQADFDDYNTNRGSSPSLPVSSSDAENYKANLRITQQHGSSSTGAPGSYTGWAGGGPAIVLITPTSIMYNAAGARWEVTIPVMGFSGFFAHSGGAPLPVTLAVFQAIKSENTALLSWQTTSEVNSGHFGVERSTNGKNWETIGTVAAMNNSQAMQFYSFKDMTPHSGENLYRLKMMDLDGTYAYSRLRSVTFEIPDEVVLYPNPAAGPVQVRVSPRYIGSQATLIDGSGKVLRTFTVSAEHFPLSLKTSGIYLLRMYDGRVAKVAK